jgi:hypothetical protein
MLISITGEAVTIMCRLAISWWLYDHLPSNRLVLKLLF